MKFGYIVGLGLACAACCAIPLLGFGGLTLGGAGVAGWMGASLDQIVCNLGPILLIVGTGLFFWQRSRKQKCGTCPADGSCGCNVNRD